MGSWIDLVRDINFANQVLSVPVTVMRPAPDDEPIETRGIWLRVETHDEPGGSLQRASPYRVISLRGDDVPTVPEGTIVLAAPADGEAIVAWRVDGTHGVETEHRRVTVLRAPEWDPS